MTSSQTIPLPDYESVADALQRCGLQQCPAELHGFALGLTVGGVPDTPTVWQNEVYAEFDPNDVLANECRALLDRVLAAAITSEDDAAYSLSLLMPGDIVVDANRVGALRDWCQGFLFGFGLGGESTAAALSPQTRGLLNDFSEFTRLDTDDVENSEENQAALIELEEYVRAGVMVIRAELADARKNGTTPPE